MRDSFGDLHLCTRKLRKYHAYTLRKARENNDVANTKTSDDKNDDKDSDSCDDSDSSDDSDSCDDSDNSDDSDSCDEGANLILKKGAVNLILEIQY